MKILLQHTGSRLFYKSPDVWVQNDEEARVFGSALEAIEYCEQHGLSGLEIVLRRTSSSEELRVGPVPPPASDRYPASPPAA